MNTINFILNKNNGLWNKPNWEFNFRKEEIIDEQMVQIKKKDSNELIEKPFILTKKFLLYLKNNKIKGYIKLNFIGLCCNKNKLKISLFNSYKYFSIYFKNVSKYKLWKNVLKLKCIKNNFQNDFIILNKIASGGNSIVFLCKNWKNKKNYAVKLIEKDGCKEKYLALINEVKILRKIKHKNVTKYNSLYENTNNFYLVMEYCNYKTLRHYINKNISLSKKICIIKQLLNSISYIHSLNIVHRDLKPENLFLHKNNDEIVLKLGDFGLSNYLNKEFIYKRCGTPGFISPEIINYEKLLEYKITKKVDVYPIGHLIYFIFTGSHIFKFKDFNDWVKKNKYNMFKISNSLDKRIKSIILECLKFDPDDRIDIDTLIELLK